MSTYGGIKPATTTPLRTLQPARTLPARGSNHARRGDSVELRSGVRPAAEHARIAEIRRQIAAGTYLTDDKLDAVVDRLHTLLSSERDTRYEVA